MLYIARHGETDWNREKRFQSRHDVPLNDNGRLQARALAATFRARGLVFGLARSSPLGRAVETLRIVLEGTTTPWATDEALLELSLGEYDGRLEAELRAADADGFDAWRARHFLEAAPGGESLLDGRGRVAPLLAALRAPASTGDVLLVGHQGINMAIKAELAGGCGVDEAARYKQANDEVDVWDVERGREVERLRTAGA